MNLRDYFNFKKCEGWQKQRKRGRKMNIILTIWNKKEDTEEYLDGVKQE